ncbi:hypothetical protein ACFL4Z_02990 [candidate division KSB1 bacterium]
MGWAVKLFSGEVIRESDSINWNDVNIHLIESLWIEGFEKYEFSKKNKNNFLEFVQFKTAVMDISGSFYVESRCIGWTDGKQEFIMRFNERSKNISTEIIKRIHFHPLSCFF